MSASRAAKIAIAAREVFGHTTLKTAGRSVRKGLAGRPKGKAVKNWYMRPLPHRLDEEELDEDAQSEAGTALESLKEMKEQRIERQKQVRMALSASANADVDDATK